MSIISEQVSTARKKIYDWEHKDDKKIRCVVTGGASIFAAYEANKYTVRFIGNKLQLPAINLAKNIAGNMHNKNVYKNAGAEAFKNSGLANNSVNFLSYRNLSDLKKTMACSHKSGLTFKQRINEFFMNRFNMKMQEAIVETQKGNNAFYIDLTKLGKEQYIAVNMAKNPYACFHEMGHALNNNSGLITKVLAKSRMLSFLTPFIVATAILRPKKPEGEKSKTWVGKGLDFVKDNCVALTAITQIPTILEEGLASIRGQKLAKQVLAPEKLKKLAKMNTAAWLTYFGAAVAVTAGVYVADKVRNFTSER